MKQNKDQVGISDIRLYVPKQSMSLETLKKERTRWQPRLGRHLDRALRVTGQREFRFPRVWEDTATMAAEAVYALLNEKSKSELMKVRHLAAGTETGLDHSKPVSAYVEGMLQNAGVNIPESISSFQVQHACAGGTIALLSVASMLAVSNREESGVVVASDISRYETETTAEITQGAGAAAVLIEKDPQLLTLDISSAGFCSHDTDDFFRPLESKTAKVKGRYSMDCYFENFEKAFADHCARKGRTPGEYLEETDIFALHTPFSLMPEEGMTRLLKTFTGAEPEDAKAYLSSKGFYSGIQAVEDIGNTYTASLYMVLAHLLASEYKKHGRDIIGKKVMLASYGSGNTMIVLSGEVAPNAVEVIEDWNLELLHNDKEEAEWSDYQVWINSPYSREQMNGYLEERYPVEGNFSLYSIRDDGYRQYRFIDHLERFREKPVRKTSEESGSQKRASSE